jgi:hypothetical protein
MSAVTSPSLTLRAEVQRAKARNGSAFDAAWQKFQADAE